ISKVYAGLATVLAALAALPHPAAAQGSPGLLPPALAAPDPGEAVRATASAVGPGLKVPLATGRLFGSDISGVGQMIALPLVGALLDAGGRLIVPRGAAQAVAVIQQVRKSSFFNRSLVRAVIPYLQTPDGRRIGLAGQINLQGPSGIDQFWGQLR